MKRSLFLSSVALLASLASSSLASADDPAGPAAPTRSTSVPQLPITQYTLDNGLTVMLSEDHSLPSVAVEIVYLVGASHEQQGRTGFAHLFEHLMFQGSANYDHEYFSPFEPIGARVNGTTSSDRTNYYVQLPSQYAELALWMESDRMRSLLPVLTQSKLDNQREVVKNERRQRYEITPYGMAYWHLHKALYPEGHPYNHRAIGSHADLTAATLVDVRDFFKKYYVANNAGLVIVGDFDEETIRAQVKKYFGDVQAGTRAPKPEAKTPKLRKKHWIVEDEIQLPRVYFAWPSPRLFDAGDAELDLLSSTLTDGKSSRLFQTLVYDQKLAKSVNAFQWSRRLEGLFTIEATAAPGVDLETLAQAVQAEVEKSLKTPPSHKELTRARNGYKKGFYQNLQAFSDRASLIGSYFLHTGSGDQIHRDFSRYLTVTGSDVQKTGSSLLNFENAIRLDFVPGKKTTPIRKIEGALK